MKKLKVFALVIFSCLVLTGCGCSKKVESYTVSFNTDGGTTVETVKVDDGKLLPKPVAPTKEGYTFKGWYTSSDGDEEFDFTKPITGNITIYARWEKVEEDSGKENPVKPSNNNDNNSGLAISQGSKTIGVSSLAFDKSELLIAVGLTEKLNITVLPENASSKNITWSSSNTDIATVSDGVVTTLKEGATIITATVGEVSTTITVKVVSKIDAALASIKPKTLTLGNTSINYTYEGCTITNTSNEISDNIKDTIVDAGVVTKLYRDTIAGTIKSTYKVVCDSEEKEKVVTHDVLAATYTYEVSPVTKYNVIIKVSGDAKDYTLRNSKATNLKYNAKWEGVQTSTNVLKDKEFIMNFNSDNTTTYKVVAKDSK